MDLSQNFAALLPLIYSFNARIVNLIFIPGVGARLVKEAISIPSVRLYSFEVKDGSAGLGDGVWARA
jgi:hypothetical protein